MLKIYQDITLTIETPYTKFQHNPIIYVSPASISIFCPNWHIAKQVLSRHLLLSSNFLCHLTYTNHCHIPIFSSIFLLNLPQQISKVSIQREALWRKYKLGLSKWYKLFIVLYYAQITILHKISAQSTYPFEPSFNIHISARCGTLQSKCHPNSYIWAENLPRQSP